MTSSASTRPEDENLGIGANLAYGLQHVLTMYGGIVAVPLIIGQAAGLTSAEVGLLIAASVALPLLMALACLWPAFRDRAADWLVIAPLPALLAALLARGGSIVVAPPPLRLTLALDDVGAMLLGGAALLWAAAGAYAGYVLILKKPE